MKKSNTVVDAAGAILLRAGVIGPQSLASAAAIKEREGGTLGEALVRLGILEESRLVAVFQQSLLVPVVTKAELLAVKKAVTSQISAELASRLRVVPCEIDNEGNLTLAMADPTDNHAVDEIAALVKRFVIRAVAAPSAIREALFAHYGVTTISGPKAPPASGQTPISPPAPRSSAESGGLPPSSIAVPAASVPPHRSPGAVLMALARAVDEDAKDASKGQAAATSAVRPSKLAGAVPTRLPTSDAAEPILLDRPIRGPAAAPQGNTLPGLGNSEEELLAPVARLRAASSRDDVVAVLLDYASLLAARVGLFVVQKGQLTCLDGRGPDHVVLAMKWFTIPVDDPSPFRDVLHSRTAYIGSLSDSAESRAFRNALGSTPGNLLLLPLIVGNRAVGVLYADEIRADLRKLSVELATLSKEAGSAFARIILSHKGGKSA